MDQAELAWDIIAQQQKDLRAALDIAQARKVRIDELSAVLEAVLVLIEGRDGRIQASAADVCNFVTAALTPSRRAEMAERAKRLVADAEGS